MVWDGSTLPPWLNSMNPSESPVMVLINLLFLSLLSAGGGSHRIVDQKWEPIGLSGGGALYNPAISPANPSEMMLNCDMSAAYVSHNTGSTWSMINHHQLRSNTRCRPAFHPTDPATIFAANGSSGLSVSHDSGDHWEPIGGLKGSLTGDIVIDGGNPSHMLVGIGNEVWISMNGGETWLPCNGIAGDYVTGHFDRTSSNDNRIVYVATTTGIWRSDDAGQTWGLRTSGLPSSDIKAFAAGSNPTKKQVILYCSITSTVGRSRVEGGIYRSFDRGESWESAMGQGLNFDLAAFDEWAMGPVAQYPYLATTNADPTCVYASNTSTGVPPPHQASVYVSRNSGSTWTSTFQADPRYSGLNVEQDYTVVADGQFYQDLLNVNVDQGNPDNAVVTTGGSCYTTSDRGAHWKVAHTKVSTVSNSSHQTWLCNGLVVTSTWNYAIDPFDKNRHFICYTDLGLALSEDKGKSWEWWSAKGRAPWRNTCYELAFDPESPGRVWGAFSEIHDIPNGNIIWGNHNAKGKGGICVSDDHGVHWRPSKQGLPEAPATSVALDAHSQAETRTLYAGFFGYGVYRSDNNGGSWEAKNLGLGTDQNRRVTRVIVHPDGTIFALVTAHLKEKDFQGDGAGVYSSSDKGEHWKCITESHPLFWPKDISVDSRDSRIIYVGTADARKDQAGVWRSKDGGAHWNLIFQAGPEHFGAYLHPAHPYWIYATLTEGAPGAGLWLSKDDGQTWKSFSGLPFSNIQRVVPDPSDPNSIYVTTFGGSVWKGPADAGD